MQELKEAYLIESSNNESAAKMFPIESNKNGEDGSEGYRYLIFPCLNELLYRSSKVFSMQHVTKNLESIF